MTGHGVTGVVLVVTSTAAGVAAGAVGRRLLGRLSRGARVRPGWCEGAVAVLWLVVSAGAVYGRVPPWWVPVSLALAWFAVLLTATDLAHARLPDALTLPAYPVVAALLAVAAATGPGLELLPRAAAGALLLWAVHAMARVLVPASLGGGDVKLVGSLGAVLGALGWAALVLATVLAAVLTLVLRAVAPRRWPGAVPYGPGMLGATWLVAGFPSGAGVPL
jgi:leader peptidase (prepilin peptidase)/N-methyltransferase